MGDHALNHGNPTVAISVKKSDRFFLPSNFDYQRLLLKGWGLEIIHPTNADILAGLVVRRQHTYLLGGPTNTLVISCPELSFGALTVINKIKQR